MDEYRHLARLLAAHRMWMQALAPGTTRPSFCSLTYARHCAYSYLVRMRPTWPQRTDHADHSQYSKALYESIRNAADLARELHIFDKQLESAQRAERLMTPSAMVDTNLPRKELELLLLRVTAGLAERQGGGEPGDLYDMLWRQHTTSSKWVEHGVGVKFAH